MQGTLILSLASILVKVIGALFTIPLSNLYGADGTAIFTKAYNVYATMYTVSSVGLPVAVAKIVAESNALGRNKEVRQIGKVALVTFLVAGALLSGSMIFGIDIIVEFFGERCRYATLVVAPTVFLTCIVSAFRGYYQGHGNMFPTAISQVIEAMGKLLFGLGLATVLMAKGYALEIVVAGAIGGVTIGTLISAVFMVCRRLLDARRDRRTVVEEGPCRSNKAIFKRLMGLAIPITLSTSIMSVTNLIDSGMVVKRLINGCGMLELEAEHLFGVLSMAQKIFNLPQTIIACIGVSVIPAISAALALQQKKKARKLVESGLRLTGLMAFPCDVGLGQMAKPVLQILYYNQLADANAAAPLLQEFSIAVICVAFVSITGSILQSMGKVSIPVRNTFIGGAVKLIANYILVGIPAIGIHGAPIGTILCQGSIAVLNLIAIRRCGIKFSLRRCFLLTGISAVVMGVFVALANPAVAALLGSTGMTGMLGTFGVIGLAAVLYFLMLVVLRALPYEDVLMLPKGAKLAKLLKMEKED
jgi:stage V sporulation protein B